MLARVKIVDLVTDKTVRCEAHNHFLATPLALLEIGARLFPLSKLKS
jgi:hypothetical protein